MGIMELLNGKVPGGIAAPVIIASALTFVMVYLLKVSPLLDRQKFYKILFSGYLVIIVLYALVWRMNPPVIPKTRIMLGPFTGQNKLQSFSLDEYLRRVFPENLQKNKYVMNWTWLYSSIPQNEDEADYIDEMLKAKLPDIWFHGEIKGNELLLEVIKPQKKPLKFTVKNFIDSLEVLIDIISETAELKPLSPLPEYDMELYNVISDCERKIRSRKFTEAATVLEKEEQIMANDPFVASLYAKAKSEVAYQLKKQEGERTPLEPELKKYEILFNRARKPLVKFAKTENPPMEVLLALAESYLLESKFGYADVVLKQALTVNLNNYKLFYLMAFLHPTRLKEIGFANELEVLERAFVINPYDKNVVLKYTDYLFKARMPGSQYVYDAILILQNYLRLNPLQMDVYLQLGYFYLYLNEVENAETVYAKADSLFPGNKDVILNRAIIAQKRKKYEQALQLFAKVKNDSDYKKVYVYMGSVYLEMEQPEKALEYFRKRVRLSRDENDPFYQEALKGIRRALQMQEEANGN